MVTENINIVVTTRGARVAARGIRGIGRASRGASTALRALGASLALIGVGVGIKGLLSLSDAATEVGNRIRTVTSSTEVFVSVQERLFDVATRTGQSIQDTARLFQRLSVGTRDLGVGTARVIKVVEGLGAALVVSGSTAREASAALLQLGQGLASDNLSGEELRSLRENLPQLAQELADVLGEPIGALKELGRQGKLTAETVFPALEIAVERFQEKLENGEIIFTFAQAFNAVRNAILKAFTIIQRATGITQDMTKAIFDLSDGLAEKLVRALARGLLFIADVVDGFGTLKRQFVSVQKFLKPVQLGFAFLGKVGVVAFQTLSVALDIWLLQLAAMNHGLQRFLRFIGLADDADVAFAAAGASGIADEVSDDFQNLFKSIDDFSTKSFTELATGVDGVGESATAAGDAIRKAAEGLREAANNPPKLRNDGDAAGPTFLERAEVRQAAIAKERDTEQIDIPIDLSERISTSFREGFEGAIQDGDDLFGAFSQNLEAAANEALVGGFQEAFDLAESLLSEAFQSATDALGPALESVFGEAAGPLGQALSGALQFVALQALSALFGGGGNKSSSSSGNVQSAVTSTQAVRGIVAGPQEIAIANVGQNIEQAFQPMLQEARVQTDVLRTIAALIAASGTGSVGLSDPDTLALAAGSAPLATS